MTIAHVLMRAPKRSLPDSEELLRAAVAVYVRRAVGNATAAYSSS